MRGPGHVAIALTLSVVGLTSCGVPSDPTPIAISTVPYGLLSPAAVPTSLPTTPAVRGPFVYLVSRDDHLVPVEAQLDEQPPGEAVSSILGRLTAGPSEDERRAGLSTAVGSAFVLSLRSIDAGRAEIEVQTGSPEPAAERLPLSVGQIVLSVTSVPGVSWVVLTQDGEPIDAPLPDGARTNRPLGRADFVRLVSRPGSPSGSP